MVNRGERKCEVMVVLQFNRNLAAGKLCDERDAYKMAKAIFQKFKNYRSVHPALRDFKKEDIAKIGALSLHPGAARLYCEVGFGA